MLPESVQASLTIYSINGQLVRSLLSGRQPAGINSVSWDGKDNAGNQVSPGAYFYELKTDNFRETKKMFILK
jgi:flagellar hook assembly protein FlgD